METLDDNHLQNQPAAPVTAVDVVHDNIVADGTASSTSQGEDDTENVNNSCVLKDSSSAISQQMVENVLRKSNEILKNYPTIFDKIRSKSSSTDIESEDDNSYKIASDDESLSSHSNESPADYYKRVHSFVNKKPDF